VWGFRIAFLPFPSDLLRRGKLLSMFFFPFCSGLELIVSVSFSFSFPLKKSRDETQVGEKWRRMPHRR
jgi:hypothetical protein